MSRKKVVLATLWLILILLSRNVATSNDAELLIEDESSITTYTIIEETSSIEEEIPEINTKEEVITRASFYLVSVSHEFQEIQEDTYIEECTDNDVIETHYRIECSDEELDMLCKVVLAEARNQDGYGKYLVACVVVNRVLSERFPNTVYEVLTSPEQFAVVTTGVYKSIEVDDDTKTYVLMALSEEFNDTSQGATFFCTLGKSHSNYATYLFTYDDHKFYR